MVARSRTGLVALVLAVGLSLAGCTGSGEPKAAVALEIGDRTITVDELQGAAETLRQTDPNTSLGRNDAATVQQQLLAQVVMVELKGEVFARAGVEIDESAVDKTKRELRANFETLPDWMIDAAARAEQMNPQDPAAAQQMQQRFLQALFGEDQTQLQQGSQDEIIQLYERRMSQVASDLGLELNPRYGEFDPAAELQRQPVINAAGGQLVELEPQQPEQPIVGQ